MESKTERTHGDVTLQNQVTGSTRLAPMDHHHAHDNCSRFLPHGHDPRTSSKNNHHGRAIRTRHKPVQNLAGLILSVAFAALCTDTNRNSELTPCTPGIHTKHTEHTEPGRDIDQAAFPACLPRLLAAAAWEIRRFEFLDAVERHGPDGSPCKEKPLWYKDRMPWQDVRRFGRVAIEGEGFHRAVLFEPSCFKIRSFDIRGRNMNDGCRMGPFYHVLINDTSGAIRQAAHVEYLPNKGLHQACFVLAVPATFHIHVHLVFVNAIGVRNLIDENSIKGYARNVMVASSTITPDPHPKFTVKSYWPSLPLCDFSILAQSRNFGFWRNATWQPFACRVHRITPPQIASCLNNKRLLFIGDSQSRYSFMHFMAYMGSRDRCHFLHNHPAKFHVDAAVDMSSVPTEDGAFLDPKTGKVASTMMEISPFVHIKFYGRRYSGFAHGSALVFGEGKKKGGMKAAGELSATYVVHISARSPAVKHWMNNRSISELPVFTGQPFTHVFATTGLHDVVMMRRAELFGPKLEKYMARSVLELSPSSANVTWFGIWAAQEKMKKWEHLHASNNVRGFSFENEARRVMENVGIKNWIDVRYMTLPREDLCIDGTHYPFTVSLNTFELWLGAICPPSRPYSETKTSCF